MDYFSFYLRPGYHSTSDPDLIAADPEASHCDWRPKGEGGVQKEWPITAVDCSLGLDAVGRLQETCDMATCINGLEELKNVIKGFHVSYKPVEDILMCALNMLSGRGSTSDCAGILEADCTVISKPHKFGAYYDDYA